MMISIKLNKIIRKIILLNLVFFFCYNSVNAAIPDSLSISYQSGDSLKDPVLWLTKKMAQNELNKRTIDYYEHLSILKQTRNFILLKYEIDKAWNLVNEGFDYNGVRNEISQIERWKEMSLAGIIPNTDHVITSRNLTTTSILLNELLNRVNNRIIQTFIYHKALGQMQTKLDSFAMDSSLYKIPNDSVEFRIYLQKINSLNKDITPLNRSLQLTLDSIQTLEARIISLKMSLESDILKIETLRKGLLEDFNSEKTISFGSEKSGNLKMTNILSYSWDKAILVLYFYLVNHYDKLILLLLFILGVYFYLITLKNKSFKYGILQKVNQSSHILRYPFASAILMVIAIFQFFLPLPPLVFTGLLWLISAGILTLIFRKSVSRFGLYSWLICIFLFILAFFDGLVLKSFLFERIVILILSISGLAIGVILLFTKKRREIKEKVVLMAIGVMTLLEIFSIYFNLTGDLNIAKILMTYGLSVIIVAYLLKWTIRLLHETILISSHFASGSEDEKSSYTEPEIKEKYPIYVYLLFFIGWIILIARTSYSFQSITGPLKSFMITEHSIGDFTFTYKSFFIFFLVLIISGFISRIVALLANDTTEKNGNTGKSGLGSWLLLIRIAIITAGIFLAFLSAGIPMDRFAIILGALSVGIGFGLQTLVNNLVSGLIIAFEKPVNVGDIVDITGQTGKMKSIGLRSSVVTTWDGADLIIPNGDLLNQHLVNWTLGSDRRRFELLLGVAYGTDLIKTRQLLLDLMLKDNRILNNPEPVVMASEFNKSSIDLIVKFWVSHFSIGVDVKSDLIIAIDLLFKEHGIVIPFPQQDVYVHPKNDLK